MTRFSMIPAALLVAFASAAQAASPCPELARRLPNLGLALCERAALKPSGAASVKGVALYQRDVPAPQPLLLPDDKPPPPPAPRRAACWCWAASMATSCRRARSRSTGSRRPATPAPAWTGASCRC
ncbi:MULTISPECIES: hypothetical protein [unclassified Rhizobacter]|uniref:hypothetical protein n=1 Tax=unclassified Rhizobacter TaxID=2640088 RepID=UPI001F243628|nr:MULTISPECIES: hypothetical protein [unclassified Rhizobacter]